MYLQIFGPLIWLRLCVYFGLFLNWGFYTAVIIASIYYQAPNPGQTWQQGFMNERYTDALNMTIPIAAGSLFLDTYIFVLPLVAIVQLQLTFKKKLGVIAVFTTGFVCVHHLLAHDFDVLTILTRACVASSLSIYFKYNLSGHQDDYTYWTVPVLMMALVEMCVGISCSCMPTTAGFFKGKSSGWKGWSVSALSMVRGLLRPGKHSNASKDFQGSWQSMHPLAKDRNNYVDIEMEGNSTHEFAHGNHHERTHFP